MADGSDTHEGAIRFESRAVEAEEETEPAPLQPHCPAAGCHRQQSMSGSGWDGFAAADKAFDAASVGVQHYTCWVLASCRGRTQQYSPEESGLHRIEARSAAAGAAGAGAAAYTRAPAAEGDLAQDGTPDACASVEAAFVDAACTDETSAVVDPRQVGLDSWHADEKLLNPVLRGQLTAQLLAVAPQPTLAASTIS